MKTLRTIAFLDCPTGISGDMCLGALVDVGVPLSYLQSQLARLQLPEPYQLTAAPVRRNGIAATQATVRLDPPTLGTAPEMDSFPAARHLPDIEQLIRQAALPARVTDWSLGIFQRLAAAEAAVHQIPPEQVHFHEVGATDAIVDIVGTCLGLDWLGVEALYCAPLPTGGGTVRAAHGRLPVPAPAVLKLMEMAQVPIYSPGIAAELVTPTGAAIATYLAHHFGEPPAMRLQRVGQGAGSRELSLPNLLRLWLGQAEPEATAADSNLVTQAAAVTAHSGLETVTVLETQVDDLAPQAIGYLYDRLFAAGALDVFTQSVGMKKSRPGHLITVIVSPTQAVACEQVLFRETTTLGVRHSQQQRRALPRSRWAVETPLGPIHLKLAFDPNSGELLNAHPEYEDCAALAQRHQLPWQWVHQQALYHWQRQQQPPNHTAPTPQSASSSLGEVSSEEAPIGDGLD